MKNGWWAFELPGYRPRMGTYALYPYAELPPIESEFDDNFKWLRTQSMGKHSLFDNPYPDGSRPDLSKLDSMSASSSTKLPEQFLNFMHSSDLHKRVRSCTDCYLDVGDFAVETHGAVQGFLFHFLSDSQWVGHWYVHVDLQGNHFVATSMEPLCFILGEEDRSREKRSVDLGSEDIWYCAPSFSQFIYRFWLENEIWFTLVDGDRSLRPDEQMYLDSYSKSQK